MAQATMVCEGRCHPRITTHDDIGTELTDGDDWRCSDCGHTMVESAFRNPEQQEHYEKPRCKACDYPDTLDHNGHCPICAYELGGH